MGAHRWEAEGLAAIRAAKVDAMVAQLGAVEALNVLEAAHARCREQAAAFEAKGWNGAARGYACAADLLVLDSRALVARHA